MHKNDFHWTALFFGTEKVSNLISDHSSPFQKRFFQIGRPRFPEPDRSGVVDRDEAVVGHGRAPDNLRVYR